MNYLVVDKATNVIIDYVVEGKTYEMSKATDTQLTVLSVYGKNMRRDFYASVFEIGVIETNVMIDFPDGIFTQLKCIWDEQLQSISENSSYFIDVVMYERLLKTTEYLTLMVDNHQNIVCVVNEMLDIVAKGIDTLMLMESGNVFLRGINDKNSRLVYVKMSDVPDDLCKQSKEADFNYYYDFNENVFIQKKF